MIYDHSAHPLGMPHHLSVSDIQKLLAAKIAEAEKALLAQTGGQSVCQLHKSGAVTPTLKYHEGKHVAYSTFRRILRKEHQEKISEQSIAKIGSEIETWKKMRDSYQTKENPSPQWVAYSQGGVDACSEILVFLGLTK